MIFPALLILFVNLPDTSFNDPDSLRSEALALAANGQIDAALALVEGLAPALVPGTANGMRGRLEFRSDAVRRTLEAAAMDGSDSTARGESLFLLGQYQFTAGRFHLAIPRFREYLAYFPAGIRANAARVWMAYACLKLVQAHPEKKAYLDSGLRHLDSLESRPAPNEFYRPLGANLRTLLSNQLADTNSRRQSRSPEPLRPPAEQAKVMTDSSTAIPAHFALQLGSFAQTENANQLCRRLASKSFAARTERFMGTDGRETFRVLYGSFKQADEALKEGEKVFAPLGYVFIVVAQHL